MEKKKVYNWTNKHGDLRISLASIEMQMKTTLNTTYIVELLQLKKSGKTTSIAEYVEETKTLTSCCQEYEMIQLLWKTVQQFLKKVIKELMNPAIPPKVYTHKRIKTST